MSEAGVHFEFYRHLQNAIDTTPQRGTRTYDYIEPEYSQDISGRADLVVFDSSEPVIVIEAKRPDGTSQREIDPYSPKVIRQAHTYASELGTPFFATYNGDRLVLFRTHEQGTPLLQRSTKSYKIDNTEQFANTLLDEISRLEAGQVKWDSLDEAFIERIRSLHEQLTPGLHTALTVHLEDASFRESFLEWTAAQGIEYEDMKAHRQQAVRERFAEEAAYLLANKIIFYKILESAPAYTGEVRPLAIRPNHARTDLETYFEEVVANIDFEAIFEHDEIYSEIPLDRVGQRISEFINELNEQDLTQFNSDVIGRIYEGVIPPERRHDLGEYYTPPAICDLITRLTVRNADDQVLDPACGSGGFPVSVYHRKRNLLTEPAGSHERVLNDIHGIDINRFPAHLTAINLAIQELTTHTENVNIEVSDFFNVNPDTERFGRTAASTSGDQYEHNITETLGGFDAVVGNPPYIRQENIDDKDRVRAHLSRVNGEYLSRQSDIYSYFITHATEFLRDGGRLGFITSDRWLDTQYGEDVQQFLLSNYEVQAIIKFDNQAFDDSLVDSSIIILEKQENEEQRQKNVTKFIRLKQEIDIEELADLVEQESEPDKMMSNESYRLVTRKQAALHFENKWNVFFFAPPIYFDFDTIPEVVSLSEVARVKRGTMTGANAFFTDHTEEFHELGLTPYVSPLMKATGQVKNVLVSKEEAYEWSILDVHHLVKKALEEDGDFGARHEQQVKNWLQENGHEALVEYIESGEDNGYNERTSVKTRKIWFDLGEFNPPAMFHTQFTWREHMVHWNEPGAAAVNQFHCIYPYDDVPDKVVAGMLNSRIVWLVKELTSRRTGGQGMTRIQTMVYETEALPIPNPRELNDEELDRIEHAFEALIERERELEDPTMEDREDVRDDLDQAVLSTIGLENRLDEVKESINRLIKSREMAAGQHTEVLVERLQRASEQGEPIDLPGVEEARESTTLSDF